MARGAGELIDHLAIPIEPQPFQAVDDRLDRRIGGPCPVGVLDPQVEHAAMMLGKKPVEERRARPADMQEPGGRGGKARDDGHDLDPEKGWMNGRFSSTKLASGGKHVAACGRHPLNATQAI